MLTHGVSAGVIQALNTHEFSDTCNNETFVNYQINIDKNEYRHLQYIADKYQQKGMIERIFTDFSTWFSVDLRRGAEPVIAATLVGSIFPVINFVFFFK